MVFCCAPSEGLNNMRLYLTNLGVFMRLPKSFRPKKEPDLEKLLDKSNRRSAVNAIIEGCDDFLEFVKTDGIHIHYDSAEKIIQTIRYNKEDIDYVIKEIMHLGPKQPFGKESGYYISAMINKICNNGDKLVIDSNFPLSGMGAYMKKDITLQINGSVLHNVGHYMSNGKIIVEGHADGHSGNCMTGGELIIGKDTGYCTGAWMKGGKITIKRDSGGSTGWLMEGGEIHVLGDIESVAKVRTNGRPNCGLIFEKGKLVWPEPKKDKLKHLPNYP